MGLKNKNNRGYIKRTAVENKDILANTPLAYKRDFILAQRRM